MRGVGYARNSGRGVPREMYYLLIYLQSINQQFGNLFGLTKLSGVDYRFGQLFSKYPNFAKNKFLISFVSPTVSHMNSMREEVPIVDPNLIFTREEIPSPTPYSKLAPNVDRPVNVPVITMSTMNPKQTSK